MATRLPTRDKRQRQRLSSEESAVRRSWATFYFSRAGGRCSRLRLRASLSQRVEPRARGVRPRTLAPGASEVGFPRFDRSGAIGGLLCECLERLLIFGRGD